MHFDTGLQNIQKTSGRVRVGNVWDDFSRSPPGIKGADSSSSSGLPVSPGGGGCQLALVGRGAILRSSPGNLYLIMQLHTPLPSSSTQYIRVFVVVVSILHQSEPMPGIHGRLTCFKRRLMRDVMPRIVRCTCSYMLYLIIVQGALSQMNMKGGLIILLCVFALQLKLYTFKCFF